jgi:Mg-chelatase subunit ChlD
MRRRRTRAGEALLIALLVGVVVPAASRAQETASPGDAPVAPASEAPKTPTISVEGIDGEIRAGDYALKIVGLDTSTWPDVRLDFSVVNRANASFNGLTAAGIRAVHDGKPLTIRDEDLRLKRGGPADVLLMIDGSGSMKSRGVGISKLGAARGALLTFVDQLGPEDRAAFGFFDESPSVVVGLTRDKAALKEAIATFTPRREEGRFTRLYDAVDFALEQARLNRIANVVIMSDGWEDSPVSQQLAGSPEELAVFKTQREQQVVERSRRAGVRIFTIAIGDKNGKGLAFVDYDALAHMSQGSDGGTVDYIDLPELEQKAKGNIEEYKKLFLESLRGVFDRIGRSMHYDYSLTLHLEDAPKDDAEHLINIDFTVEQERLPGVLAYTWKGTAGGDAVPIVTESRALPGVLIAQPREAATRPRLAVIFFALLVVLLALALVPVLIGFVATSGAVSRLRKAIVTVGGRSPLAGRECPNERDGLGGQYLIKAGDVVVVCPACNTPHHLGCWQLNRDVCWNRACEHNEPIPDEVARRYQIDPEHAPGTV